MEKDYYTPDTNPKDFTLELSKWINECLSLFISECCTWSSPLLKDLFEECRTQFSSINFKLTKTKSIKGYKDILQGLNSEDISSHSLSTSYLISLISAFNKQSSSFPSPNILPLLPFSQSFVQFLVHSLPTSTFASSVSSIHSANGYINLLLQPSAGLLLAPQQKGALQLQTVGVMQSVFKEKFGTPRQSGMVANARGRLAIRTSGWKAGDFALLLFVFHLDEMEDRNVKGKIMPPKLEGRKMGVFATRTPHRYNPIGLSICKVEQVEDEFLELSGIDLVDQTPVVGIWKYEDKFFVKPENMVIPKWLEETKDMTVEVTWSDKAKEILREEMDSSEFYKSELGIEEFMTAIEKILELNPHTVNTIKRNFEEIIYAIQIDNFQVIYQYKGIDKVIQGKFLMIRLS